MQAQRVVKKIFGVWTNGGNIFMNGSKKAAFEAAVFKIIPRILKLILKLYQ